MDHSDTADLADTFRARGAAIADACTSVRRLFSRLPDDRPGRHRRRRPVGNRRRDRRSDHRRRGQRGGDTLGRGVQRQRLLHPGLQARHQSALHGAAGARLCPPQRRQRPAREALGRPVPDDEPRRARAVAAADPARDAGALRAVARDAHEPARRRLLYRLQRAEDAAHRAAVPRHSRPARGRLRGHGRGRAMLRRLPVPRRRFRREQQGRLCDDRRAGLGRRLDRAVLVPVVPDLDRRGVVAELRAAVRQQAVRPEPVSDLSRRPMPTVSRR